MLKLHGGYILTQSAFAILLVVCAGLALTPQKTSAAVIQTRYFQVVTYERQTLSDSLLACRQLGSLFSQTKRLSRKDNTMSLIRYQSPEFAPWPAFDRLVNLRDELSNLFDLPMMGNLARQAQLFSGWNPPLDLYQTADNIIAAVEIPGMRKEDIDISLHNDMLTISGERASTSGDGERTERTERFSGKFRRSISLPTRVEPGNVSATYKDGILTVTLPKAEEAKPKKVDVNIE
jgi:HSP20 family protein